MRQRSWLLVPVPILVGAIIGIRLGSAVAWSRHGCITVMRGGWCTHFVGQRTTVGGVVWGVVPVVAGLFASVLVARARR